MHCPCSLCKDTQLVDLLYDLGISISYDIVLEISAEEANTACTRYEKEQVICPSKLKFGLFTTSAIDNIDHNPSSTTSQGSFHGTGISVFQHPSANNPGLDRSKFILDDPQAEKTTTKTIKELSDFYSDIPSAILSTVKVIHPLTTECQPPGVWKLEDCK